MTRKTIPFLGEKAYYPFYALAPDLGFVVASVLTTSQEIGLRVAARLVAGQAVVLDDGSRGGIILKRQKDVEIPLPRDAAQSEEDTPVIQTFGCEGWRLDPCWDPPSLDSARDRSFGSAQDRVSTSKRILTGR